MTSQVSPAVGLAYKNLKACNDGVKAAGGMTSQLNNAIADAEQAINAANVTDATRTAAKLALHATAADMLTSAEKHSRAVLNIPETQETVAVRESARLARAAAYLNLANYLAPPTPDMLDGATGEPSPSPLTEVEVVEFTETLNSAAFDAILAEFAPAPPGSSAPPSPHPSEAVDLDAPLAQFPDDAALHSHFHDSSSFVQRIGTYPDGGAVYAHLTNDPSKFGWVASWGGYCARIEHVAAGGSPASPSQVTVLAETDFPQQDFHTVRTWIINAGAEHVSG